MTRLLAIFCLGLSLCLTAIFINKTPAREVQLMIGAAWLLLWIFWHLCWAQTNKRYTSLIGNVDYRKIPAKGGKEVYMKVRAVFQDGKLYEIYPPHRDSIEY